MRSLMLHRFYAYGLLCRLGGCFFIQKFCKKSLENTKVEWKSLYTIYSASCVLFTFGFFIWFETAFLIKEADTASAFSGLFSETLSLTLHAVVSSKILLNFISMATGSGKLLDFFRKAAEFEESTGFPPDKSGIRTPGGSGWSILRRTLVLVALAATYAVFMYLYVTHFANAMPPRLALASKVLGFIAAAILFLYDSLCYVVLRCCTGVLIDYIHAQLVTFEDGCKCRVPVPELPHASRQLESVRLNVCSIRELTKSLNNIWKTSLAGTCAGIILVNCVVLYTMFHDGVFKRQVWITLSYSVYSSLAFVELVYISQALMDQAQKLKNAAKAIRTSDAASHYAQELRYLHESIDPKGMCLSGGGFFRLSKSLLVSVSVSRVVSE
ncbi:unnamed protein product [Ixodes hexagonus]